MLAGTVMEIPSADLAMCSSSPPLKVPRRLRDRLLDSKAPPPTSQDIEAKLRCADLRRQKFYESLSRKACPKRKTRLQSSCDGDLGLRLQAKLHAASQKRLDILANARMRLARLDELRQSAKNHAEMRSKKEREMICSKVASRFQQAETNRSLILKAYRQRRANIKERVSQSALRKVIHERKYMECVRAVMHQKRIAAEKKRIRIIEAEKNRACTTVLQARKVAKSVVHQREIERRRIKNQLEDRLQRAKKQRADHLRARMGFHGSLRLNYMRLHGEFDLASKKIARCWRHFQEFKGTTLRLAQEAYDALNINEKTATEMPFEQLASLIESTTTLETVKNLLDRLELRYKVNANSGTWNAINDLLKKVVSPRRKSTPSKQCGDDGCGRPTVLLRYQVRVFLCAYMILAHPDAVFSGKGELETALAKSSKNFVQEFETLMTVILCGTMPSPRSTFKSQLNAFDAAWCAYLNSFVAWKVKDARLLEDELVRTCCQLELSMIQTCKMRSDGESSEALMTHDMRAVKNQVMDDQRLLRERIHRLSGDAGVHRMQRAISCTREKYFQGREERLPAPSPQAAENEKSPPPVDAPPAENAKKMNRVARALFRAIDDRKNEFSVSLGANEKNELIVNEAVHNQCQSLADVSAGGGCIDAVVAEAMKKAFWDGVMEESKSAPNHDRVIGLAREMRDGICEISPDGWKKGIMDAIDLGILSRMLKEGGEMDMGYLERTVEFALMTLRRLSAPALEEGMMSNHAQFLKDIAPVEEVASGVVIKGLRFVLEEVQVLRQEISRARIRALEPVLKGSSGLGYLGECFRRRYGSPSDAPSSLPSTLGWILSFRDSIDRQWSEHSQALLTAAADDDGSCSSVPRVPLKTGHALPRAIGSSSSSSSRSMGISGVDLIVRVGLVKLVSGVEPQTEETLPETLRLNMGRIRGVQAEYQKMVVVSTSALICRQILLGADQAATAEGDAAALKCIDELVKLLNDDDVMTGDIIRVMSQATGGASAATQQRELLGRMLVKSLRDGDAVFERVSDAVRSAVRGALLCGNCPRGRSVARAALQQVRAGTPVMLDKLMDAADVLLMLADVTVSVHGPWYSHLVTKLS